MPGERRGGVSPGFWLPACCEVDLVGSREYAGMSTAAFLLPPSVSPVSENQVASSEGYVLFYQLMQEPARCL